MERDFLHYVPVAQGHISIYLDGVEFGIYPSPSTGVCRAAAPATCVSKPGMGSYYTTFVELAFHHEGGGVGLRSVIGPLPTKPPLRLIVETEGQGAGYPLQLQLITPLCGAHFLECPSVL